MKGDTKSESPRIRSWVAIDCGRYRSCVAAEHVVSVDRDVGVERSAESALPFVDLSERWEGSQRTLAPWAVWLQTGDRVFGVAVDDVRQFNTDAPTRPFPGLGLRRTGLFEGCLDAGDGIRLVLSIEALVELTAEAG